QRKPMEGGGQQRCGAEGRGRRGAGESKQVLEEAAPPRSARRRQRDREHVADGPGEKDEAGDARDGELEGQIVRRGRIEGRTSSGGESERGQRVGTPRQGGAE